MAFLGAGMSYLPSVCCFLRVGDSDHRDEGVAPTALGNPLWERRLRRDFEARRGRVRRKGIEAA